MTGFWSRRIFRRRSLPDPGSRLKRDIAMKVLPAGFAQDAERVARFRREAQRSRLLMIKNQRGMTHMSVVLNWPEMLRGR